MEIEQVTQLKIDRYRERCLSSISWAAICALAAMLAYIQASILTMCLMAWACGFLSCWSLIRIERYLQLQVDAGTITHKG